MIDDLDRAIADSSARQDYNLLERARGLAGAARWNAAPMVKRLTRSLRRGQPKPLT